MGSQSLKQLEGKGLAQEPNGETTEPTTGFQPVTF